MIDVKKLDMLIESKTLDNIISVIKRMLRTEEGKELSRTFLLFELLKGFFYFGDKITNSKDKRFKNASLAVNILVIPYFIYYISKAYKKMKVNERRAIVYYNRKILDILHDIENLYTKEEAEYELGKLKIQINNDPRLSEKSRAYLLKIIKGDRNGKGFKRN